MTQRNRGVLSANLCNASMLLYMTWLLLPAVQTTLHAVTGALAMCVFGIGVVLDGDTLPKHWRSFVPRVLFVAVLPLALFFFMQRGGNNLPGYYAQQGMFWFPLLWCAYARERGDDLLYRFVKLLLITGMVITTLTTIGWLIQGLLRGDKVYAYARSLGSGEPDRADYLRELMRRNIGGYDFIYASVLALPITFYAVTASRGWKRFGFGLLYLAQIILIGLSQYTYAILFAVAITAVEGLAALFRAFFRRLSTGASLLVTIPFFAAIWLLRVPLIGWAGNLAAGFGFENATYSFTQLLNMMTGGVVDSGSRLSTYAIPLAGIAASPLVGSLFSGVKTLGMHSDLLDLLSGMGILGTTAFAFGAWVIGRGSQKGFRKNPAFAQVVLQYVCLFLCLALGTVFYSREIPLVLCLTAALLLREPSVMGTKAM